MATKPITKKDSLKAVQAVLMSTVDHISFIRNLFPSSCFEQSRVADITTYKIKDNCSLPEAKTLRSWIAEGATDALKKGYLSKLVFVIARDAHASEIIEEYVFRFGYGANKEPMMEVTNGKRKGQRAVVKDEKSMKLELASLVRSLISACSTLSPVPDERFLLMKLEYTDSTPEEYQPPCFVAENEDKGPGFFVRRPLIISFGRFDTSINSVSTSIKTVLDGAPLTSGTPVDEQEASMMDSDSSELSKDDQDEDEDAGFAKQLHRLEISSEELFTEGQAAHAASPTTATNIGGLKSHPGGVNSFTDHSQGVIDDKASSGKRVWFDSTQDGSQDAAKPIFLKRKRSTTKDPIHQVIKQTIKNSTPKVRGMRATKRSYV